MVYSTVYTSTEIMLTAFFFFPFEKPEHYIIIVCWRENTRETKNKKKIK